jgi:hypothetical protein
MLDYVDAAIPDREMHLIAFDVADSAAPRVDSFATVPGHAMAMARVGRYLLVPLVRAPDFDVYWTGIRVYDTSPETGLELASEVECGSLLMKMHVAGDRLVAAGVEVNLDFDDEHAASLFDLSDPLRPRLLSEFHYGRGYVRDRPALLEPLPSGEVLLLTLAGVGWTFPCCDGDTLAPSAEVALPLDELGGTEPGWVWFEGLWEMSFAGSDLYALDASFPEPALAVFDLREPSSPRATAVVRLPGPISPTSRQQPPQAATMAVTGDRLVLSAGDAGGVRVVDIGDRTHPEQVGTWRDLGHVRHLATAGDRLYTLPPDGRLARWDARDGAAPRLEVETWTVRPTNNNALAVGERHVFVRGYSTIRAVRIADGALEALPAVQKVRGRPVPHGDRLYVADSRAGLHVLGFEGDGERLVRLALITPVGEVQGVAAAGDLVYVASGEHGLAVLDVADPNDSRELGYVDLPGIATEIALLGTRAFVLVAEPRWTSPSSDPGPARLFTVDVADPSAPRVVGSMTLPYVKTVLWRQRGERLFTLDYRYSSSGGPLTLVDLGGDRPQIVGQLPGAWRTADMGEDPGLLYAADGAGQLVIGRVR